MSIHQHAKAEIRHSALGHLLPLLGRRDGSYIGCSAFVVRTCKEAPVNPRAFMQTMIALASASLGLVAALAWNEAIKATLVLLGLGDSLAGLYTYAVTATVIAVAVLVWLGRLASRIGGDAAFQREAEG